MSSAEGPEASEGMTPFEIPGGWSRQAVKLAGHSFQLVIPADPDCVLESQLAAEADGSAAAGSVSPDPYWAALWSSATPTAEAVLRAEWRGDESVLELGCGAGLVGLAALARGLKVTFSDYVPQAIELARQNARLNGFPTAQCLLLDWHFPPQLSLDQRYAVLLASDVLYDRSCHQPLLDAIDRFLAADGVCWIGDPGRFHARSFHRLASRRFHVQLRDQDGQFFHVPAAGSYQMFVLRR